MDKPSPSAIWNLHGSGEYVRDAPHAVFSEARRACASPLQIPVKPSERTMDLVYTMQGFTQTVTFARITDQRGFNSAALQGCVHLLGLGDGHVIIPLAVDEHGRRRYVLD